MLLDISPLRKNKDFRNLFFGQLISSFGTQLTAVVIPFQVYSLTHASFYTGVVSAVECLFLLGGSLLGGALADRCEKRSLLLLTEAGLIFIPLLLALHAARSTPGLTEIMVLAGIASFLSGLHRPALESITPRLVPAEDLPKVSALAPIRNVLTTIISPMVGGILISTAGASITYLFDCASFVISLGFLLQIKKVYPEKFTTLSSSFFAEIREGLRYLKGRKEILGSYLSDFVSMVFCNPVSLFPALAAHFQQPKTVGILYALPAVGALGVTIFSRWTLMQTRYGRWIILAGTGWALSIASIGWMGNLYGIWLCLLLAGAFDMVSGIFRMTLWNETIAASIRGRLAGFEMLSYTSGPLLGNALLGFLGDRIGIQSALCVGGLTSMSLILLTNLWRRELWQFQAIKASYIK